MLRRAPRLTRSAPVAVQNNARGSLGLCRSGAATGAAGGSLAAARSPPGTQAREGR